MAEYASALRPFLATSDPVAMAWKEEVRMPLPDMSVADFVETLFVPQHVAAKGPSGRRHYRAILKHVLTPAEVNRIFSAGSPDSNDNPGGKPGWPYMNNVRLAEVGPEHVHSLVRAALECGYSTQTVKHIRNAVSAIFSHAIKQHRYLGRNPACLVITPNVVRKKAHALSLAQTIQVFNAMRYPEREMALLAILTSMNISEICGLQWKHVNLMDRTVQRGSDLIPPRTIAVKQQFYRGEFCAVPEGRRKNLPISQLVFSVLMKLGQLRGIGGEDFVIATKSGRPVNQINIASRRLKHIGERLGLPQLSWQVLRRTGANLSHEFGTHLEDRFNTGVTQRLAIA